MGHLYSQLLPNEQEKNIYKKINGIVLKDRINELMGAMDPFILFYPLFATASIRHFISTEKKIYIATKNFFK